MYKIRGADGQEYGPATAEQVRQWIMERRLNAQSLARLEGTEEWKPLAHFPEFAATLATSPVSGPIAPIRAVPPTGPTNSLAVASLIVGCLAVCCQPLGIVGLILSIIALWQIKTEPTQGGKGFAVAGLALSIFRLGLFFVVLGFRALRHFSPQHIT